MNALPALAGVLLAGMVLGGASPATEPTIPPVRIDAVVTDARGRRVLDLGPQDFEVRANGALQTIRVELRRNPDARVFAFYLDEFHVAAGQPTERARAALLDFVDASLRPGDLAVVLRPLQPVTALALTADRASLKRAIASFDGRKGDYAPRTRFEELYIGRAPAAVVAARSQIVTVGLTELALQLGERNVDRAAIVLVSDGFDRGAGGRARRAGDLQGLARAAGRLHLAVYAFSPSAPEPREAETDALATLRTLARQTGGDVALGPARFGDALRRVAADLDAYYALTFDPQVTDGRFHPVEVRAKRPGLRVRARSGYWAPLDAEWRAWLARPANAAAAPVRELRRSPLIDAWIGVVPGADGGAELVLSWEPSARGRSAALAGEILVRARTAAGAVLFEGRVTSAGGAGDGRVARFAVPPGRVQVDLTIPASDGTLADEDRRDVDVPDLAAAAGRPLLLPPAVYRARSARAFRAIIADPQAPPTPARAFSRGDRLLIRAAARDARGSDVAITARVLNALGHPMRDIARRSGAPARGVAEFELPLSWLAPGEYEIEIAARTDSGSAAQRVAFALR